MIAVTTPAMSVASHAVRRKPASRASSTNSGTNATMTVSQRLLSGTSVCVNMSARIIYRGLTPARPVTSRYSLCHADHADRSAGRLLRDSADQPERRAGDGPSCLPAARAALSSGQPGNGKRRSVPAADGSVRNAVGSRAPRQVRRRLHAPAPGTLAPRGDGRSVRERLRGGAGSEDDRARGPVHQAASRAVQPGNVCAGPRAADGAPARAPRVHLLVSHPEEVDDALGQLTARDYRGWSRVPRGKLSGEPAATPAAG